MTFLDPRAQCQNNKLISTQRSNSASCGRIPCCRRRENRRVAQRSDGYSWCATNEQNNLPKRESYTSSSYEMSYHFLFFEFVTLRSRGLEITCPLTSYGRKFLFRNSVHFCGLSVFSSMHDVTESLATFAASVYIAILLCELQHVTLILLRKRCFLTRTTTTYKVNIYPASCRP